MGKWYLWNPQKLSNHKFKWFYSRTGLLVCELACTYLTWLVFIPAMNLTFSCCCYLGFLGVLTSHQVLSLVALRCVIHLTNLTLSIISLSLQGKFAWIISEVKACCTILYKFSHWSSCMYNWQYINTTDFIYNIDIWAILFSNIQGCTCI